MTEHKYTVLLSGGKGIRFWPKSRLKTPKQFLPLFDNKSLFEQTLRRVKPLFNPENIYISTLQLYRKETLKRIAAFGIPEKNVIFEPESKNTAASIALSMQLIQNRDPQAKVCVLPCDHLIRNNAVFGKLLKKAFETSESGLVIFGIPPDRPATGYGYIKIKTQNSELKSRSSFRVEKFVEKPDLKTAQKLYKDSRYFWNSGMFSGRSSVFLNEIKKYSPGLFKQISGIRKPSDIKRVWGKAAFISFDYAVLEKTKNLFMLPAQGLGWSDVGSWQAYAELLTKDKEGNHFTKFCVDAGSRNTTVLGNSRLIATLGLDNIIIVDTQDALLVARKDKSEEVKKIVNHIAPGLM